MVRQASTQAGQRPNRRIRQKALDLPMMGPTLELGPTLECRQQMPLTLVVEPDPDGRSVGHYRVSDVVARLVANGMIAEEWALAADRFRRDFHRAHFEPLSALDPARLPGNGTHDPVLDRVEDARRRVHQVLDRVGGINTPAGSALWFVIGNELSIQQWALRQGWGVGRPLRHEVATGIVIAALAALAAHYDAPVRHRTPTV